MSSLLKEKKAFTLMEVVVTISIIAIMSVVIVPKVGKMLSNTKDVATKKEMREIRRAILGDSAAGFVGYSQNMDAFPSSISDLYTDPGGGFNFYTQTGWNGPYVDYDGVGVSDIEFDAWGNAYSIINVTDGKARKAIVSCGPDEQDDLGTDDDIVLYLE